MSTGTTVININNTSNFGKHLQVPTRTAVPIDNIFKSPPIESIKPTFLFSPSIAIDSLNLSKHNTNNNEPIIVQNQDFNSDGFCCCKEYNVEAVIVLLQTLGWYFVVLMSLYSVIISVSSIIVSNQIDEFISSYSESSSSAQCIDEYVADHTIFKSISELMKVWQICIWSTLITSSLIILIFIIISLLSFCEYCGYYIFDKLGQICNLVIIGFIFNLCFIGMMQYFCWSVYHLFSEINQKNECDAIITQISRYYGLVNDWVWIPSIVLLAVIICGLLIWFLSRCSKFSQKINDHYNDYVLFSG